MSAAAELFIPPRPRWCSQRSDWPTHGDTDAQVAKMLGWDLFVWQHETADLAGEYDPVTGRPRFRTVGVSVARQNGKTTLVLVRIGRQLLPRRQTVAYTAQDRSLARTKWMEHVELLMDTPFANRVERVDRQQNREVMVMKNGSRYLPVTPSSKKAGRSLSLDLAIIDEAYSHEDMGVVKALNPTLITRPMAQLWIVSNAGDADSGLWWHYTELGRRMVDDPDGSMCWVEYAPPGSDPAMIDVHDEANWVWANPSMGEPGGVDMIALRAASKEDDPATFRKEHLNLWVDRAMTSGLTSSVWGACYRDNLTPAAQVAFGLDFDPERRSGALVAAGLVTDLDGTTITPLEVIEVSGDLSDLAKRAAANAVKFKGVVVVQSGSPAASEIPALERATATGRKDKHRVQVIAQPEMARAVGSFFDAAAARRLSHRNDSRLNDAVAAAVRRDVGDTFVWERRVAESIAPLTAATLARWGVLTIKPAPPAVASIGSPASRRTPTRSPLASRRVQVGR